MQFSSTSGSCSFIYSFVVLAIICFLATALPLRSVEGLSYDSASQLTSRCSQPPSVQNGEWVVTFRNHSSVPIVGSMATLKCKPPYLPPISPDIRTEVACTDKKPHSDEREVGATRWDGPLTAECKTGTCAASFLAPLEIHPISRRAISGFVQDQNVKATALPEQSKLRLRCAHGSRMVGCTEVQCSPRGWVCASTEGSSLPRCIPSPDLCPPLPEFVRGGAWRLESYHQLDHFAPGDIATLSCNSPGFAANSFPNHAVACEMSGNRPRWNVSELPACISLTCPPVIPASFPSGVRIETSDSDSPAIISPVSGHSAMEGSYLRLGCIESPRVEEGVRPMVPIRKDVPWAADIFGGKRKINNTFPNRRDGEYEIQINRQDPNEIRMLSVTDGKYRFHVQRLSPDHTTLREYLFAQMDLPPEYSALELIAPNLQWDPSRMICSTAGQWIKTNDIDRLLHLFDLRQRLPAKLSTTQDEVDLDESSDHSEDLEHLPNVRTPFEFPDCAKVAFSESKLHEPHSTLWDGVSSFCPPLPFFSDPSIPGWVENSKQYASNSIPLHFSATLDCGNTHWPESASTNEHHTEPPTAKCVPFLQSKSTADDDEDADVDELALVARRRVIGRWQFRHGGNDNGEGKVWTSYLPPTCVPRPSCDALPIYSGWRLASGLAPNKFYANDVATCATVAQDKITAIIHKITCTLDADGSAQIEPSLSPSELMCEEVTCPAPGGFPNAFRFAQLHTNFIGYVNSHSIIDDDVRLDYFAEGDELHYMCYFGGSGFTMKCSSSGEWTLYGPPCSEY